MDQMLYVVLLLPLIFTLVTASISHFLTAAIKFSCYFSNEIVSFVFFISGSGSFSVIHAPMQTLKLSWKKESALLLLLFIF